MSSVMIEGIVTLMRLVHATNKDAPELSYETMKAVATHEVTRDLITSEIASQVLWFAEGKNGDSQAGYLEPGSFFKAIYDAAFRADGQNFGLLAMAYPEQCWAVKNYQVAGDGVQWLKARAAE